MGESPHIMIQSTVNNLAKTAHRTEIPLTNRVPTLKTGNLTCLNMTLEYTNIVDSWQEEPCCPGWSSGELIRRLPADYAGIQAGTNNVEHCSLRKSGWPGECEPIMELTNALLSLALLALPVFLPS